MISQDIRQAIEQGKRGENKGLPTGIKQFDDILGGVQRGTYYLVGAGTGLGKTAFIDNCFVFSPLDNDVNVEIIYFSLEITKKMKYLKALARKIHKEKKVLTDTKYLLSKGDNIISEEVEGYINEYSPYIDNLEKKIHIYDEPFNPSGIYKIVKKHLDPLYTRVDVDEHRVEYIPKDPNKYILIIIDHIGLIKVSKEFPTKKLAIDQVSSYMVTFRDKYNATPILISQFNRSADNPERRKQENQEPLLSDFKETGATQEDCSTCISLFSPHRYKMTKYLNYNVRKLEDRIRGLYVLKQRDGIADVVIPTLFIGETGEFYAMPKVEEMTEEMYNRIVNLKKIN